MIEELLQGKTGEEKANIKAAAIAGLNLSIIYTDLKTGIRVEVRSVSLIDRGIEIIARAWKGVNQLGFGTDGSIEWERFKILNPPIMVDDPNGTVIRSWTDSFGVAKTRKLREDPIEAIKQCLAHTIKVSSREGTNIIKGSVGNTTTTFFPDAGTGGSLKVDGMARRAAVDEAYATIHDGAGTHSQDTGVSDNAAYINSTGTTNQFGQIGRSVFNFDTSSIGSSNNISAATLSIDGGDVAVVNTLEAGAHKTNIFQYTPGATNAVATAEYNIAKHGSTQFSTDIGITSWSTTAYNDFSLNASGRAQISKTGTTSLGMRESARDAANVAPTWSNQTSMLVGAMYADNAGTTRDPKLVVTYAAAGGGVIPTLLFMNAG